MNKFENANNPRICSMLCKPRVGGYMKPYWWVHIQTASLYRGEKMWWVHEIELSQDPTSRATCASYFYVNFRNQVFLNSQCENVEITKLSFFTLC